MQMKDRLVEFLAYLGLGQNKFEEIVGLSRGFVHNVGDSIREVNLAKILAKYPELNVNWLKTGEGNMLRSAKSQHVVGDKNQVFQNGNGNVEAHQYNHAGVSREDMVCMLDELWTQFKQKEAQVNRLTGELIRQNEELRDLRKQNTELTKLLTDKINKKWE